MNRKKVIIDTDPGIDDALALMYAFSSPELEILGITVSAGNTSLERTAKNALKIGDLAGSPVPVYKGAERPLRKEAYISGETHGEDGLGDANLPESDRAPEDMRASDFMLEMARKYPGEVTIIALAPLTNLAEAIEKDPKAMKQIREIVSMGGAVATGNMSPVAEFNYWFDPEAAKIVYDFDVPVTMIGLNVTTRVLFTPIDFSFIEKLEGNFAKTITRIQKYYVDFYWKWEKTLGCVAHDVLAVAAACDPSLVETVHCHVDIATDGITRGECVADLVDAWKQRKNSFVAVGVDAEAFRDSFYRKLFPHASEEYAAFQAFRQKLKEGLL